jgi:hypothetical protein
VSQSILIPKQAVYPGRTPCWAVLFLCARYSLLFWSSRTDIAARAVVCV